MSDLKEVNVSVREQLISILGEPKTSDAEDRINQIMGVFGVCAIDPQYLAGNMRHHGNYTLGVLLTAVEAALGDSKQAEALKAIVRREMFALMDRNQAEHYESLGMQQRGLAPKETRVDGQDELR